MDGFEKEKERGKELAEAHWGYHEVMLKAIAPTALSGSMGDWYKAIAIHFYMHGIEDSKKEDYTVKQDEDDDEFKPLTVEV